MVNLIRKYQQGLMIVVTIVIIVCFVWFYNGTRMDQIGSDQVATAYGRGVTIADFQRGSRKFEVGQRLMLFDLLQALAGNARSLDEARENFVMNTLVLRHEADALGITTTDDEIVTAIQQLPVFQTNGAYDSSKYNQFISNVLAPNGFSADQLEEIIRDRTRLEKLKGLIGATVPAPANEVRSTYEMRNRKTELSYVQVKLADFLASTQVTDDDLKKVFDERKETLKSEEKRKVRFVAFTPPTDPPLAGKERVEAMSKLADRAQEFTVAMTAKEAKFDEVAAKFEGKPAESPEFTRSEAPAELGSSPEVAAAAFALTEKEPNSDVITTNNGYYVLQLAGVSPARPLTFEEARTQLAEQLKQERSQEALELKATEIRNKIVAEQKAGKSFADAAAAAGAKVETFPAFSLMQPDMSAPHAREIISTSVEMREGQISDFVRTADGGVIVHLDKRHPIDEEQFKKERTTIAENVSGCGAKRLFKTG
jgi:peptidyl-prolyl cis-trans isomerase D